MKNLIYQYWDGKLLPGVIAGRENMKKYAERVGVEYLFEHNPKFVTNLGKYSPHYGAFKPVYNKDFHVYDNVLFADLDVFAVDGLKENIFENFNAEIGICTEPHQPQSRAKRTIGNTTGASEEKWAATIKSRWNVELPRTPEGLLKVYNSGVVLYSNKGLLKAKEKFVPFKEYVNLMNSKGFNPFYTGDQNYLNAMLKVVCMDYVELDNGWNCYVHYLGDGSMKVRPVNDMRTENTKFVHVQLSCADHYDADTLWRITNLSVDKWNLPELKL